MTGSVGGRDLEASAPRPLPALVEDCERVVALLGRASRAGPWQPPERVRAIGALGRVRLDFRAADLPAGVTDVEALAFLGRVCIDVPRGVDVEFSGVALLGGLDHGRAGEPGWSVGRRLYAWLRRRGRPAEPPVADDDVPLLRVRGTAVLGRVEVRVSPGSGRG